MFNLGLLADEVLHLLSQEVVLVDVHVLQFPEVMLEVDDILHDLLERLVVQLDRLMLEGRQLTPQQLRLLLVLVQVLVELHNVLLHSTWVIVVSSVFFCDI